MKEELYTPQEVADLLRIKKNTVYEMVKRGEMNCKKIGKQIRISQEDLDNYLSVSKTADKRAADKRTDDKRTDDKREDDRKSSSVSVEHRVENAVRPKSEPYEYKEAREQEAPKGKSVILCGQDILLEVLCNYLAARLADVAVFRSYKGSYNGLYDLYQDKVDIATVHLWDGETGEYNKEYVKRMLPGTPYCRVHLICRIQGFYVKKGNPKDIRNFLSLTREDVVMINREKGSGTRILLDEYLIKNNINKLDIRGYSREVNSHLACAGAVARGSADVSLGIERVSKEMEGIEFIPIQTESYDLVVKEESIHTSWFQTILEILNSREFQIEVDHMSGYDTKDMGKILL